MENWVIVLIPISLGIVRAINWPTALVMAVALGVVATFVGWLVTLVVSMPMVAFLLIRARSRRLASGSPTDREV
jgi:hypothetical protein